MNNEIKQLIINEIDKYESQKSLILKTNLNDITLYEILENNELISRIFNEREDQNITNLLLKYNDYLDNDILIKLCQKDFDKNKNRYHGMLYLLNTNKKICNQLLSDDNDIIKLINIFGYIILKYINSKQKNNKEFILSIIDNNQINKNLH